MQDGEDFAPILAFVLLHLLGSSLAFITILQIRVIRRQF